MLRLAFTTLAIASCSSPLSGDGEQVPVDVALAYVGASTWSAEFAASADVPSFTICVSTGAESAVEVSLALQERRPSSTVVWAQQFGIGSACIAPEDGAFEDIVLTDGTAYRVVVIGESLAPPLATIEAPARSLVLHAGCSM